MAYQCEEGDGHHAFARVTVHTAESVNLLQKNVGNAGLFFQFATCTFFGGFRNAHESARKSPFSFERLKSATNQQQVEADTVKPEYDTVGRDRRVGVFVMVFEFL